MRTINKINSVIDTAQRFVTTAYSTEVSGAGLKTLAIQSKITVTTPAAVEVAEADVDPTEDTLTAVAHGFLTGTKVQGTTGGTLPGGLSPATDYFVIRVDADTFKLATSLANAQAGTDIDISDDGTGASTWTPVALAGATVKLQKSVDGGTTYHDDAAATNITVAANFLFEKTDPTCERYRLAFAITAGELTMTNYVLGKSEEW